MDRALAAYVASIGDRLVRASGDRRSTSPLGILDDSEPQAFASVGTTIWLTRGAVSRDCKARPSSAAMLAHQLGHVLAGHAHEDILNLAREISRDDFIASRDDEIQADELAVSLTARAGYDATAVETMLRALAAGDPTTVDESDHHPHMARTGRPRCKRSRRASREARASDAAFPRARREPVRGR